jgi:hypothetical protein
MATSPAGETGVSIARVDDFNGALLCSRAFHASKPPRSGRAQPYLQHPGFVGFRSDADRARRAE